jgi:hypothetical protein
MRLKLCILTSKVQPEMLQIPGRALALRIDVGHGKLPAKKKGCEMAFVYRAWPSTKAIPSRLHRWAIKYQVKMHSTAITISSRYGVMAFGRASGSAR